MAEQGWRSPGEVWRAYEETHPFCEWCGVALMHHEHLCDGRRLTADEQVAAQVLDARINRAEQIGGYRGECRVEHQARTERYIVPGGGLV